jgi:hypothetical protein
VVADELQSHPPFDGAGPRPFTTEIVMKIRLTVLALALACVPTLTSPADAGVMDDISAATSAGRLVFVAVSDGAGPGMTAAQTTAQRARGSVPCG